MPNFGAIGRKFAVVGQPAAGRGTGRDGRNLAPGGRPAVVNTDVSAGPGGDLIPAEKLDGKLVVMRRHIDWIENQVHWRWLMDSFEGGPRYRNATYGPDRKGLPTRNLFRHKREYPDPQQFPSVYQGFAGYMGAVNARTQDIGYGPYPGMLGADPAATAQDDDYELRRSRTPVPEFVAEAVEIHLGKLYDQEVSREGPGDLVEWWKDVDGRGTPIDDWVREVLAPLLLVLGCLDVCLDHPQAPPGQVASTRADELRMGLDRCVASYILPQNMLWYRLDAAGRYRECLVREYTNPSERVDHDKDGNAIDTEDPGSPGEEWRRNYVRYRLWRPDESIVFTYDGDQILDRVPHRFGQIPIVRLVDLYRHRTPHIGKSRYEAIAEYQREYYNRDSELILSDTLQAHPFLSGPEDFCKSDNTLSIGPGYLLPKKKNPENGNYEGFEYVCPPKDPAESLRKNKDDIVDMKDRRAGLMKPAGASMGRGHQGGSVTAQSGLSKKLDSHTGHKILRSIAQSLAKSERMVAEYAAMVLRDRPLEPDERAQIAITYPARFELTDCDELIDGLTKLQLAFRSAGEAPETELEIFQTIVRQLLIGLSDEDYRRIDAELEAMLEAKATLKEQHAELRAAGIASTAEAMAGAGSAEEAGGEDPTGQTGSTMVSGEIPAVM